jgi:exopolyphosphatase / guanosine-5'-triphosphate,3'-diphosphate pyrophosphatase
VTRPRAAVDCGTNSTRLLVVDAAGRTLERITTITRLGAGVDARGHLDDGALTRTLEVIAGYRDTWTAHGVAPENVRVAATSAVRDATDRERFFTAVHDLTGVAAEVLSGDDEARMAFLGAVGAVDVARPVAVVDIGGGSTELILGDGADRLVAATSLQLGTVRVTERHLAGDPPGAEELAAADRMIAAVLDDAAGWFAGRGHDLASAATLVGVAGTVTTLAATHLALDPYRDAAVHGQRLAVADVAGWADRLAAMTVAARRVLPGIPAGREDVIAAGARILLGVMHRWGFDEVVVSAADNLDGLIATATR